MEKVTMQDIANHLNISKNSVSQALRNKDGVSENTKKLVRQAADDLGYFYYGQSSLPVYRPKEFLLLATSFALTQISFFGEIITSMEKYAKIAKGTLTTIEIKNPDFQDTEIQNKLSQKKWDGIFILSHITNSFIQDIISLDYPCVVIDHHHPHFLTDTVVTQNNKGSFSAVEQLIKLNHNKIGFIGDVNFSPSYEERLSGYLKALSLYDLPVEQEYILSDIKEDQSNLYSKLDSIHDMPTAWFCVNSGIGFILNSYFQSKGVRVPDDISILCFDNTEFTRLSNPKLSCIATDLDYMGKVSIDLMLKRINNPNAPFIEVGINPELIIRDSTNRYDS